MNSTPISLDLVVLCGGRGVRLRPATDSIPKALVPVDGRPIIDHIFDFLTQQGMQRVHLCIGYKGDMVRHHFASCSIDISFSDLGEDASMLSRLFALRNSLSERFLIAYCDTYIDLNIEELLEHHQASAAKATIITASISNPFGIVSYGDDNKVRSFQEKPVQKHFIGYTLMERSVFDSVTPQQLAMPDGDGLVALFNNLIKTSDLSSYEHEGLNITFNTASERMDVEHLLQRYYTLQNR